MELRQLEYFVHVADEGTFTRAAAVARVAQPGVSAQIQRLERELGEALFDRTNRRVRLTEAGAAFLPFARAALAAVSDGRIAVGEIRGLVRGRVRIGMMAALPSIDLAGLLADFRDRYPGVGISLTEASSSTLLEQLLHGDLDVAVVGLPQQPPSSIHIHPLRSEPLVVATSRDDPLGSRASIHLGALRNLPIVSLPPGSGLRAFLHEACRQAGFEPNITLEASDPGLVIQLTAHGLGISVLPASLAAAHTYQVRLVPIRPPVSGRIALAWRAPGAHSPSDT